MILPVHLRRTATAPLFGRPATAAASNSPEQSTLAHSSTSSKRMPQTEEPAARSTLTAVRQLEGCRFDRLSALPLLLFLTSAQHFQHPSFLLLTGDGDVSGRLALLWGVGRNGTAALAVRWLAGSWAVSGA